MNANLIVQIVLPLMLALIMFALGMSLRTTDFVQVAREPRAFAIGAACHFIVLPAMAAALAMLLELPPPIAVGLMIIAACPTGSTSNLLAHLARGDVALAVSFTAFASLATIVTLPLIVSWSFGQFLGTSRDVQVPVAPLMAQVLLVVGAPVAAGMALRHWAPAFAERHVRTATRVATGCFVLIVAGAVTSNWKLVMANFAQIAPACLVLCSLMLAIGYACARAAGVDPRRANTVAIESAVQNGPMAVVIGATALGNEAYAIPGALYGLLSYLPALAFVFWARRAGRPESSPSTQVSGAASDARTRTE